MISPHHPILKRPPLLDHVTSHPPPTPHHNPSPVPHTPPPTPTVATVSSSAAEAAGAAGAVTDSAAASTGGHDAKAVSRVSAAAPQPLSVGMGMRMGSLVSIALLELLRLREGSQSGGARGEQMVERVSEMWQQK